MQKIWTFVKHFLFIALILIFLTVIWSGYDLRKIKGYVMLSGSMSPQYSVGSVIFTYPQPFYFEGDVVTYLPDKNQLPVTHRITKVSQTDTIFAYNYLTQGDANKAADLGSISDNQIIGKTFLTIPYIGYITTGLRSRYGFIFLIIVPATILVYEEFKSIFYQLKKILNRSKLTFENPKLVKFLLIICISVGSLVIFLKISTSLSYFSDAEKSQNNIFQAASEFISTQRVTQAVSTVFPSPTITLSPTPDPSPTPQPSPTLTPLPTILPTPELSPEQ